LGSPDDAGFVARAADFGESADVAGEYRPDGAMPRAAFAPAATCLMM